MRLQWFRLDKNLQISPTVWNSPPTWLRMRRGPLLVLARKEVCHTKSRSISSPCRIRTLSNSGSRFNNLARWPLQVQLLNSLNTISKQWVQGKVGLRAWSIRSYNESSTTKRGLCLRVRCRRRMLSPHYKRWARRSKINFKKSIKSLHKVIYRLWITHRAVRPMAQEHQVSYLQSQFIPV